MDLDVGEFLDSLQLNNLKDIFEKEQASSMKGIENTCTVVKRTSYIRRGGSLCRDVGWHMKNEQQESFGDTKNISL